MGGTLRLALATLVAGGAMGLVIWMAAWAAGRRFRLPYGLGGAAWGIATVALLLTDCLVRTGPGPLSEAAFPLYFGGLVGWPVALAWGQPRWPLRWLLAQLICLLTLAPAFLVAVAGALCVMQ